jgi:hypothetical protein
MGFPNAYSPSSSSSSCCVVVNKLEYFISQMAFGNAYVPLSSSSSCQQIEFGNAKYIIIRFTFRTIGFRVWSFFLKRKTFLFQV